MRIFLVLLLILAGCSPSRPRVVVYCAHDREFADEILQEFAKKTGLEVVPRYDTEANKSVGLYEELIREKDHPRCDVHWNNEVLATIRLQEQGLLHPYESPASKNIARMWKSTDGTWTGFAGRARVILVNKELLPDSKNWPGSWEELTQERWKGKLALARPIYGTTASQMVCLHQAWGAEKATRFFQKLAEVAHLVPGNKQAAVKVGAGEFALCLTDTDDALAEIRAGRPVTMLFPHETLVLPNTVAIVKGAPNLDGAKKLVDYLLSPEVEAKLAQGPAGQIPLNPDVRNQMPSLLEPIREVEWLQTDFTQAARQWNTVRPLVTQIFGLR